MKPILIFRHAAADSMGTLDAIFRRAGVVFSYVDVFDHAVRAFDPGQLAGLVVLGGSMNVDQVDKYPFLTGELRWIRQAVDCGLPVMGICLGAQLMAHCLGAPVHHNPIKEIGWYPLQLTPAAAGDLLFQGVATPQTVFHWHGDTFDLPAGAELLARGETCANQAFRVGANAWGVQFHPEVTTAIIDDWLTSTNGGHELAELDYIDPSQIRARTPTELPGLHALGDQVFGRFAALCRERSTGG